MSDSDAPASPAPPKDDGQNDLRAKIMAIMRDTTLSDAEKAQRRQQLMCGGWSAPKPDDEKAGERKKDDKAKQAAAAAGAAAGEAKGGADLLEDTLNCVICRGLCERPVTGPCQHNFCLACFKRWLAQGKKTCPTCRAAFPRSFVENPRINTLLTYAIRCAKQGIKTDAAKPVARIADESRPAEAFTTERAVRAGRANAASGRIMVTVPNDHFGPILPEHDPTNGKGVQVGDWWKDRLDCRQWGAHFPHVAGIAGQSNRGAQSVVLSGGYEDDHDEGEWFLYTGSGGRDLSGNKRTNKTQSFDQEFEAMNKALKISCLRGLPVRVVRSSKEKRSSYAPPAEAPVRYDGVYRILRCWRKPGAQGFLMCRYLFVRADNSPAPWTSDEAGDAVRLEVPDLAAKEIAEASGAVHQMGDSPYWDFSEETGAWGWTRDPPPSQKAPGGGDTVKKLRKKASAHERLLKDFACGICKGVLEAPLSMPCGHNFCKGCLDARFAAAEASKAGGSKALAEAQPARSLRVRKVPKPCPTCKADISDYMAHAAVNTEMDELIRRLQAAAEEARRQADSEAKELAGGGGGEEEEGEEGGGEGEEEEQEEEGGAADSPRPAKKQRTAAAAEPAAAEPSSGPAAAAAEPSAAAAPAPAAAEPPAAASGAPRFALELSQLSASFPEFDQGLIAGLLEDQGGDADEVHACLKRMKNQEAHAKRQAAKATEAGGIGGKGGAAKGRRGGKKKQAEAEAVEPEEARGEQGQEEEQQADGGEAAEAEDGAAAADTQPESDTSAGAARKAAAAAAAAAKGDAGADAGPPPGGKKRRQSAAAGKAAKRAK